MLLVKLYAVSAVPVTLMFHHWIFDIVSGGMKIVVETVDRVYEVKLVGVPPGSVLVLITGKPTSSEVVQGG